MASRNTDFLRFSAYSIKDAITRKLSEDSKFTDQVFEGSNLAILIDIVSYMYQCLIYQLNNAASESMFSDTQLYSNITRLIKFIGYNPKGCTASNITLYINNSTKNGESLRAFWLPAYSRIDTGLQDANGKKIYFSLPSNDSRATNASNVYVMKDNISQGITLYNGQWKLYKTVFTASGINNETFVLDGLRSDKDSNQYVAHDFIDIYVSSFDGKTQTFSREQWELDKNGIFTGYDSSSSNNQQLFNNQTAFKSLYPGTYPIYTVYLNQDKTYELKFGNGIVGKKLNPGDKVYVFYLETNGPDGKIDVSDIDTSNLKFDAHNPQMFGISQELYNDIFMINDTEEHIEDVMKNLTLEQNQERYSLSFATQTSTTPQVEESVEDIRNNAPLWFTTGNRLVTRFDYEYYLKNTRNSSAAFGCDIIDVKCMNNWEYLATFYKWLYSLGMNGKLVKHAQELGRSDIEASGRRYLTKDNFTRFDYFYADAADANNLYIWIKAVNDSFDAHTVTVSMNNVLNPIKLMTAELVACKAINVCFDICAAPDEYVLKNYLADDFDNDVIFDENCESYIEVTLDDNVLFVSNTIQKQIASIIIDGFNVNSCTLGQLIKYDDMLNKIYEINGVQRIRTVFNPKDQLDVKARVLDGLSFASWSNAGNLIEVGDDLNVSNNMRQLEDFQFPIFTGESTLMQRIKIIRKSLSNVNTIKF